MNEFITNPNQAQHRRFTVFGCLLAFIILLSQTAAACVDACPKFENDAERKAFYLTLIQNYRCSAVAETRLLSGQERLICMEHYLKVKLAFTDDLDPKLFESLSIAEKIRINKESYARFKAWELANSGAVRRLKEVSDPNI